MEKIIHCDVLIVGAGPAGLSVASGLSSSISSIIVHMDDEIGKPVRTSGGSWLKDMNELSIPESLYQVIDELDIVSDNEKVNFSLKNNEAVVLDITGLYLYLESLSIDKQRELFLSSKFLSSSKESDGCYKSVIESKSGGFLVRSKYIVDASGWKCSVLENFNLIKRPERIGVGLEYEYQMNCEGSSKAALFVGKDIPSGYGWVFPTNYGTLRVGVGTMRPDNKISPKKIMNEFLKSDHLSEFNLGSKYETNSGVIPAISYSEKLVFDRIIRVGDSANFATPTVGEGIRVAIKFGRLLGESLSEYIDKKDNSLDIYEKKCLKSLSKNYGYGFLVNKRISLYSESQWDSGLRRISKLKTNDVIKLLKSEFTYGTIFSLVYGNIRRKIFG